MVNILAFDTSQDVLSVAACKDGIVLVEQEEVSGKRHSITLLSVIRDVMKKVSWGPEDLDLVAVGVGPGSFTGLRVGVTTAKILAYAWNKKLQGVSSLEAAARTSLTNREGQVAVALDARKGQIYAALYKKRAGKISSVARPRLTTIKIFSKKVKPGFLRVGEALGAGEPAVIHASKIAEAAMEHEREGRSVSPEQLEPLYLYPRDCNVTRRKK